MAHTDQGSEGNRSNSDTTEINHDRTFSVNNGDPSSAAEETVRSETREEAAIVTNEQADDASHEDIAQPEQEDNPEVEDYSLSQDELERNIDGEDWQDDPELQKLLIYTGNWNNSTSPLIGKHGAAPF